MDKHAKTEQDLREEHLQQITGGCGGCKDDKILRDQFQDEANRFRWLADGAGEKKDRVGSLFFTIEAQQHSERAKQAQARINARRGTAGHPPALGESSNAVPDLNQLRLQ
jgi:hypothetical protein